MNVVSLLIGLGFGGAGVVTLVLGVGNLRDAHVIRSNDPVTVRELQTTAAPLEFEGTVELAPDSNPMDAPYSGEPAVCYRYRERERRSGNNSSSSWRTVESGAERQPFVVDDGTGRVQVDPTDATLQLSWETVNEAGNVGLFGGTISVNVDVGGPIGAGSRRRRYQEQRLEVGDPVHVFGARVTDAGGGWDRDVDVSVAACEDTSRYQISHGDESDAYRSQLLSGLGIAVLGLLSAGIGVLTVVQSV